MTKALFRLTI